MPASKQFLSAIVRVVVWGLTIVFQGWNPGLHAQGGWMFGPRAGYGPALLYNKNWANDPNYALRWSDTWNVGITIGYNMVYYNYGLFIGGYFRRVTQRLAYQRSDSLLVKAPEAVQIDYLEIPFLVRFRPRGERGGFFTWGGPYLEIGAQIMLPLAVRYSYPYDVPHPPAQNVLAPWNVAIVVGFGGHQIGIERWSVTHGVRIVVSIMDIVNRSALTSNMQPHALFQAPLEAHQPWTQYAPTQFFTIQYFFSVLHRIPKMG